MPTLVALLACAALAFASFAQSLPTDPRIVSGKLDNGLTYYVLRHDNPPGRASVWMHIYSGSLNETEDQRGLAHFLEHMAFNGSANFEPGTVVKYFESLGLTFGRHQNAFTSFDQTTYQLALPDNSVDKLSRALLFMADVNSRLLLNDKEIDSERQIILEEKTARKSAQQRLIEYVYSKMAPGSIYGERIPIGTEERIRGVSRADFMNYYRKWYGPANASVIVVGDLDPAVVVAEITKVFGELPKSERATPQDPGVKAYDKSFAVVATDPETTRATVAIGKIGKPHPPVTTVGDLRAQWVRSLASSAFRRRVQDKKSQGGKLAFDSALVFANNLSGAMWQAQALASGDPAKWRDMLRDLGAELQRARTHGFTSEEVDASRRDLVASLERRAASESTFPARAVIQRINGDLSQGEPLMSAAQTLELATTILPGITVEECSAWFTAEFEPTNVMFLAQLPSGADVPTEAELLELGNAALSVTPDKEERGPRAGALLEKAPVPGKYVEPSEHAATGVWSAWLDNGVMVHHRFMDYRKHDVTITITLYGGELLETKENRGIGLAAALAFGQPSTGNLSSADVRELMSGKKVSVSGRSGLEAMQLTVSGNPDDIESGLTLAHLLLTNPRIEQSAFDRWKTAQLQNLAAIDKSPAQKFGVLRAQAIYPDDEVRAKLISREMIERITIEQAQAWLNKLIAESPIEVAIVGEIPRTASTELVAKYIGSIPARKRITPNTCIELRTLARPQGPRVIEQTMVTATPLGNVMYGFYGPDEKNLADVRALNLAAQILSSRMIQEVREKDQLVYSIGTRLSPGTVFPGFGVMSAASPTQPEKADALATKIASMFDAFARDGATEEELRIAKLQAANTIEEGMKEPGYWLGKLELMTHDAVNLDDVLAMPAAVQAVTAAQVKDAFTRYYKPEQVIKVVLKPAAQ